MRTSIELYSINQIRVGYSYLYNAKRRRNDISEKRIKEKKVTCPICYIILQKPRLIQPQPRRINLCIIEVLGREHPLDVLLDPRCSPFMASSDFITSLDPVL